ncbi:hypothetical protein KA047_00420 [Candidatus Saccharibacteria bacterium]|nr:hypothetical protein [Candidatus Saccharibacteria bacterium]
MELEIIRRQIAYDPAYVDLESWGQKEWKDQKTNHILLHIGKASLKFAGRDLAKIQQEVIPDMAMATAQLVHLHGLNPHEIIGSERPPVLLSQMEGSLLAATGYLASYLEPQEHGAVGDKGDVLDAAKQLYRFTRGIADFYGIDLVVAHRERLAHLATVRPERLAQPLVEAIATAGSEA